MQDEIRELKHRIEKLESQQLKDYEELLAETIKTTRFLSQTISYVKKIQDFLGLNK